jgi:hypothetical protein
MNNDKKDMDGKSQRDNRRASFADRPGGGTEGEPPKVTGIQDWKNRASARSARAMLCEQKIRLLSTPQKQALLIRLIVHDDITPKELDALLGVLAALA